MVKIKADDIRRMKGKEIVVIRQEIIPILRLREFMGLQGDTDKGYEFEEYPLVVLNSGMAVVVDEFVGEQEIIIRPLSEELSSATCFLGAAILGDGNIVLVLNTEELAGGV
jgi:two-component system chemotaxis sensor kinase CheA